MAKVRIAEGRRKQRVQSFRRRLAVSLGRPSASSSQPRNFRVVLPNSRKSRGRMTRSPLRRWRLLLFPLFSSPKCKHSSFPMHSPSLFSSFKTIITHRIVLTKLPLRCQSRPSHNLAHPWPKPNDFLHNARSRRRKTTAIWKTRTYVNRLTRRRSWLGNRHALNREVRSWRWPLYYCTTAHRIASLCDTTNHISVIPSSSQRSNCVCDQTTGLSDSVRGSSW
ncbi:hypothetical protein C8F01DRAFT_1156128 [Mycena amicta]|nr:hypothetical protein C8F01DRAFT_1156128 [Mycena amicta]